VYTSNLNIASEYNVIYCEKGCKPLCFIEKDLLVYKAGKFLLIDLVKFTKRLICSLDTNKKNKFFSKFRLLTRLLRLEPRGIIKVDEKSVLISFKGSIYNLDIIERNIKPVHRFKAEMSAPLCLAAIKNIKGFKVRYCYGEYFGNSKKDEVSIYGCYEDNSDWHEIYRFKKGQINHIHSIIPDPYQNKVWIFTVTLEMLHAFGIRMMISKL